MSARVLATGFIAEPDVWTTKSGKPAMTVSVAATYSQRDRDTGQWDQVGEDLWLKVTLWDKTLERYRPVLRKGSRITVEGTLVMKKWATRDGNSGVGLELRGARVLGVVPSQDAEPGAWGAAQQAPATGGGYGPPRPVVSGTEPAGGTPGDPWGQFNEEAPF